MEALLQVQILGWLSIRQLLVVVHLIGLGFGFGGALASDFMFVHALRDWKIDKTEFGFLKLASRMVWIGVVVLFLSGLIMFLAAPAAYLASGKFMAKMTVVVILVINGFIFHYQHIPLLGNTSGQHLPTSREFIAKSRSLFVSGAISMVSWFTALVLGALRGVPYSYVTIMLIYLAVLAFAIVTALLLCRKLFPGSASR